MRCKQNASEEIPENAKCLLFPLSFIVAHYLIFGYTQFGSCCCCCCCFYRAKEATILVLVNKFVEKNHVKRHSTRSTKKTLIIINAQDASFAF